MKNALDQSLIRKAMRHLKSSDRVISALIKKHGPCTITPTLDNPFHALASSIISQQLSAAAARAIKSRLLNMLDINHFTPDSVLKLPPETFRTAGLSQAKMRYIRGVALAIKNGEFDFVSIARCEDQDIIDKLTTLAGVGTWTAEMFLIFGLGRPDVLSISDAGLKRAFQVAYNFRKMPSATEMIIIGESWRPYRSVASWYLWRVVD
jgi:DNA-3-methyladenine glycosylase II